ncbi:MAG: PQQ-dependent sugar dehydrogenase, partial [Solirubrobacterales bacterium]
SYGLRNPFRFSFDTTTAKQPRIAIGDVGQNRFEELDYTTVGAAKGANFGWDAFEGFHRYEDENSGTPDPGGTTKPVFAYSHNRDGSCSIIGGYVVRDPRLKGLRGQYVYADLCEGRLRALVPHLKRASDDRLLGPRVASPSSFGEDDHHRLYVASLEGPVYRLVPR